jgi:hypothetical protein
MVIMNEYKKIVTDLAVNLIIEDNIRLAVKLSKCENLMRDLNTKLYKFDESHVKSKLHKKIEKYLLNNY